MTKKTKLILGAVIVGALGYFYWKSKQKPKAFANLATNLPFGLGGGCPAGTHMAESGEVVVNQGTYNPTTGETEGKVTKKFYSCVPNTSA